MILAEQSFGGTCPTCGQRYCEAEIERLRETLSRIRWITGIEMFGTIDDHRARAMAHDETVKAIGSLEQVRKG